MRPQRKEDRRAGDTTDQEHQRRGDQEAPDDRDLWIDDAELEFQRQPSRAPDEDRPGIQAKIGRRELARGRRGRGASPPPCGEGMGEGLLDHYRLKRRTACSLCARPPTAIQSNNVKTSICAAYEPVRLSKPALRR